MIRNRWTLAAVALVSCAAPKPPEPATATSGGAPTEATPQPPAAPAPAAPAPAGERFHLEDESDAFNVELRPDHTFDYRVYGCDYGGSDSGRWEERAGGIVLLPEPGKTTFHWWNGTVEHGPPSTPETNFAIHKKYIDFCSRNNIEYHSVISVAGM